MEIRVLRYFLTIVQEESITKAAELLHITQPTLSRQIAQMEELNILFTSNLPSNSSVMVHHGLAYSLIIRGSISFWDQEKIVYRPLFPELTATSVLAWRRKQPFGLAATKFIAHIKENLHMKYNQ